MACTWNPSDKTTGITLSDGNLTAEESSGTYEAVRGTLGHDAGKWYFEFTVLYTLSSEELVFGVATLDDPITTTWLSSAYNAVARQTPVAGTVYGVAYDGDTGKFWYSSNGVWAASGDPAAGTNAIETNTNCQGNPTFPYFASDNGTPSINGITANFSGPFTYTVPSGFSAFDPVIFAVTSISPNTGSTAGGTPVTIVGTGFDPDATAAIDGNDLTDITVIDDTTITGITPAGTAGAKDVVVTNP